MNTDILTDLRRVLRVAYRYGYKRGVFVRDAFGLMGWALALAFGSLFLLQRGGAL